MLQVEATITQVKTMADRSLRLQVDTQEILDTNIVAELFSYYGKYGNFAFSEGIIKKEELKIPEYTPTEKGDKTPSQRLRAVLYLKWESEGKPDSNFDAYYRKTMELIIEHYKSKLPKI